MDKKTIEDVFNKNNYPKYITERVREGLVIPKPFDTFNPALL